jgi:hypothetical protein
MVTPTPVVVTVQPRVAPAPAVVVQEMPAPTAPVAACRPPSAPVQQVAYTNTAPARTVAAPKNSKPAFPRSDAAPPRKPTVDITTASCSQHADDYSWLIGAVDYSRLDNGWRLRYAGLDEADKYGGSVTLTGNIPLTGLQDGARLRVKGHLQNPEDGGTSPAYHVDSLEVLNGPQ